ncbi:MAG TPA: dihydroorotase [Acidobacteriota bacterium]|nr:dihydroorotase [Acidobacteriota bacterium]
MGLLIRGGRVVDPDSRTDAILDVLVSGRTIEAVGPRIAPGGNDVIDASGLVVAPGFIDMHVHLREPGNEKKETIRTAARAAARGGFTTICGMPNTNPANDTPAVTEFVLAEARRSAVVNVLPIAAVTRGLKGDAPSDWAALVRAGAVAFSDDGRPVGNTDIMRQALERSRTLGALIIDHCEDLSLTAGALMNEGPTSRLLGLKGMPAAAEEVMVVRDIRLAEAAGARVHIAHLSVRGAVRAVAEARERGVRVSAEATPHHLLLDESLLEGRDANFKMNPPLRSVADVAALVGALRDGVVDVIATDHAPHTEEEKTVGFEKAPFGIVGLETAVPVLLDRLVRPNTISLSRFIALLSLTPARLLGLGSKGRISAGADADLTLLDLEAKTVVDRTRFESRSRNTPFNGWSLRGAPAMTVVGGKVVYPFDRT